MRLRYQHKVILVLLLSYVMIKTLLHKKSASTKSAVKNDAVAKEPTAPTGQLKNDPKVIDDTNSIVGSHPYTLLADFDEPYYITDSIPLFFLVPRSAGTSMRGIFQCLRKVQTRKIYKAGVCEEKDDRLEVCSLPFGKQIKNRFVNIDTNSLIGIRKGKDLGLLTEGAVEGLEEHDDLVVTSTLFYDSLRLFNDRRRARLVIIFRHPVERVISKFYSMKNSNLKSNYNEPVASMTLLEYAHSSYCDSNLVTRRLVNKMKGDLTDEDFILAKEIVARKTLVLLTDDMEGSVQRVLKYFGWYHDTLIDEQKYCLDLFTKDDPINVNKKKEHVKAGGREWNVIRQKNIFDIELMAFAKKMYKLQGKKLLD